MADTKYPYGTWLKVASDVIKANYPAKALYEETMFIKPHIEAAIKYYEESGVSYGVGNVASNAFNSVKYKEVREEMNNRFEDFLD